jgi:hypothetical protein
MKNNQIFKRILSCLYAFLSFEFSDNTFFTYKIEPSMFILLIKHFMKFFMIITEEKFN